MNEASSDVLKIIIGVVLTILVALMAFGFYNKAQDMSKTADEQLAQMDDMLKNGNLDKYDGATVKGSEVISCIQSNKNAVLCVQIVNGGTTWQEKLRSFSESGRETCRSQEQREHFHGLHRPNQ